MVNHLQTTVVVADSHPSMLFTSTRLLDAEDDLTVTGSTGDLERATAMASEQQADVMIIDLHMLEGSSRAAVASLRRRNPDTAVVILTMEATQAFVAPLLDAGASGYVLKEFADSDLAHAVREAAGGRRFVSEKLAA
ncbi:MAG TPA: response regulator transcription factor [Solirubrobacteraceae bacterium]|nr:response regulator transcription factor [Solirubrobacteraceae bacterium]